MGLATAQGWRGSGVLRVVMVSGASVPVFLACLLGMLLFYRWLNILPVTGQTAVLDAPTGPTHFLLIDSLLAGRPEHVRRRPVPPGAAGILPGADACGGGGTRPAQQPGGDHAQPTTPGQPAQKAWARSEF